MCWSQPGLPPPRSMPWAITNQRETTVIWDPETGQPVYNDIIWQDKRPMDRIDQLVEDGWEETIRETTGSEPDHFFGG